MCLFGLPEHSAELLHVVELEHFQLLLEGALAHDHVHELLLAIGAHGKHLLYRSINESLQERVAL
jgi:hypothetical protein